MASSSNTTSAPNRRPQTHEKQGVEGKVIDPVRILRQHTWLLIGAFVVGGIIGGVSYVACFSYRPTRARSSSSWGRTAGGRRGHTDARTADTVTRLARTETGRVMTDRVLTAALEDRDVRRTYWAEQFQQEGGQFDLNEALIELEKELAAYHVRDTNTFVIVWSGRKANDVPVILTSVQESYMSALEDISSDRYNSNLKTFTDQRDDLDSLITFIETEKQDFVRDNNITSLNEAVNERRGRIDELIRQISETSLF